MTAFTLTESLLTDAMDYDLALRATRQLRMREEVAHAEQPQVLPTHIPTPETMTGSSLFGGLLSFICLVLLALILRLAVPVEDNSMQLGLLLLAVGYAQVWLIFLLLRTMRR